jgi:glycine/D-amino acid oxidase-like deaminating enzyme
VTVLDAGPIAGGASSAGEGNLLVSDKPPGPELDLMLWSLRCWAGIGEALGADAIELEPKGGLIVAASAEAREALAGTVAGHRAAGVEVTEVAGDALSGYEPMLAGGLAGGAHYPQDAQVQPMLATALLLAASGAEVRCGVRVRQIVTGPAGAVTGVRVDRSPHHRHSGGRSAPELVRAGAVVNATGVAGGELAAMAGTRLPIEPRRGFVLVTQALPPVGGRPPIRGKVYAAEYAAGVASDDAGLRSSAVVEGTRAGTVLIGASRERVGFDPAYPLPVLRALAAQAVALFPFLAGVRVLRAYRGFRPYTPDHLPVIGPDPHLPGLWHACGHEGAGVGLAPATGALIAAMVTGADPELDPAPFAPARFL